MIMPQVKLNTTNDREENLFCIIFDGFLQCDIMFVVSCDLILI